MEEKKNRKNYDVCNLNSLGSGALISCFFFLTLLAIVSDISMAFYLSGGRYGGRTSGAS